MKNTPVHHYNPYKKKYVLDKSYTYFSNRYNKYVYLPKDFESDGATGAVDLSNSAAYWVHDWLCDHGKWSDLSPCTNWQASQVLSDILKSEGRWFRARTWFAATWLFGGGKARQNGMI